VQVRVERSESSQNLEKSASVEQERETKFFVPRRELERSVILADLPRVEITQHSFPEKLIPFAFRYAQNLMIEREEFGVLERASQVLCRSARVRRITSVEGAEYSIELKSSRAGPDRARVEIKVPLSESEYSRLVPRASDGALKKTRHYLSGELQEREAAIETVAEIDIITHAGQTHKAGNYSPPCLKRPARFVLLDIEFRHEAHAELANNHFHSFDFLKEHAINLTHAQSHLRKPLSARQLARNGIDQEAEAAIGRLLKFSRAGTPERANRHAA
jgi:hypothetical protein